MDTILLPNQYNLIYNFAYLCIISSIYAYIRGYYDLQVLTFGIFLTSCNYWRHPDYSWRRYIDIFYVNLCVLYQSYRAINAQNAMPYYSTLFISIGCYPIGIYFYKKKLYWYSTYSHCLLHTIANISNIILYYGEILPAKNTVIIGFCSISFIIYFICLSAKRHIDII